MTNVLEATKNTLWYFGVLPGGAVIIEVYKDD